MAVTINIPSQVKTYANLAAFPASGSLKTIYIAEDTNKTYRWTGSVYVEISASAAMTWGAIGGTLSNQTDLQNALDAKVPTSRTLTINGVTQDLSADRTFTIATGITVGTTPIASGTIGRVLFQGTGNVLQQSSSLAYDDTLKTFTLIGPIGSVFQHTALTNYNGFGGFQLNVADGTERAFVKLQPNSGEFKIGTTSTGGYFTTIHSGGSEAMRIFASTRNIGINTTTDAGFRLDVNGTARFSGSVIAKGANASSQAASFVQDSGSNYLGFVKRGSSEIGNMGLPAGSAEIQNFNNGALGIWTISNYIAFGTSSTERMRLVVGTGNVLINTTTDAGFRLDVNGTARINGSANSVISTILNGAATNNVTALIRQTAIGGSSDAKPIGLQIDIQGATDNDNIIYGRYWNSGTPTESFYVSRNGNMFLSGRVGIGVSLTAGVYSSLMNINASAQFQIDSTTRGFLPPRMTTTQKNAIASPAAGLMVYDTTLNVISYYNGTMWI